MEFEPIFTAKDFEVFSGFKLDAHTAAQLANVRVLQMGLDPKCVPDAKAYRDLCRDALTLPTPISLSEAKRMICMMRGRIDDLKKQLDLANGKDVIAYQTP